MRLRLTDRGRGNVINRNAIERKYINSRTDGRTDGESERLLRLFIYTHTFIYIYIHIYLMSGRLGEARERVTLQKRGSESRYQGVGDRETSGRLIRPRLFIEKRRDSGTRRHDGKLRGGRGERERRRVTVGLRYIKGRRQ